MEGCRCPLRCAPAPSRVRDCRHWPLRWRGARRTARDSRPGLADHRRDAARPGRAARRPVRRRWPARPRTAPGLPPTPSSAARSRCSPTPPASPSWPTAGHSGAGAGAPGPRSVLGDLAATVYGNPSERLPVVGITGTSGKTTTTYLVEAGLRAAGRTAGLIGTIGIRIDGADVPSALTTPEAPAPAGDVRGDGRAGVDTVVMEVSSHALALGRVDGTQFAVGAFHQPVPRPPRLPPDHGRLLRRQGAAVRPGRRRCAPARAVVCVDDDAGRAMADRGPATRSPSAPHGPARATGAPTDVASLGAGGTRVHRGRPGRRASPGRRPAAGSLQHRQLPCRAGDSATRSGFPPEQASPGLLANPGSRPDASRSTAARISSRWSTTRTSRARCGAVLTTLRARIAGWRWCSAPGGDRDAGKRRADGRGSPPSWPTWWSSPTTTRAARIPAAIRARDPGGRGRGAAGAQGGRDRRPARRPSTARRRSGRAPATWC